MTRTFQTTSQRGLNQALPPMRLWHKAKKLGVWDPQDIDFSQDAKDWAGLSEVERDLILRLTALFQAGEEAVTLDLLPLIEVIAREGRLEEEIFLTSFLWEEAKHVEAFRRFLDEAAAVDGDLSHYHSPNYSRIFYEELPAALNGLREDSSPEALANASVTYNMIVEGVLAETGYHAFYSMLKTNNIMPGMVQVTDHLKRDESRHLAYGVYLLSRLVAEHGDPVWQVIETRMNELLMPAIGIISEIFPLYDPMPFGLKEEEFAGYAMMQFQARMTRIGKARQQSLTEVNASEDFETGTN